MKKANGGPGREWHARLCAYLLGELDEGRRVEVERELTSSAELRAEKERLAATIALVRAAAPREDALPPRSRAAIAEAAARGAGAEPAARPWPLRPVRRPLAGAAAAAAVLALAGAAAWLAGGERRSGRVDELARGFGYETFEEAGGTTDAPAEPPPREGTDAEARARRRGEALAVKGVEAVRASKAVDGLRGLGYVGEASDSKLGEFVAKVEAPPDGEHRGRYRGPGDFVPAGGGAPLELRERTVSRESNEVIGIGVGAGGKFGGRAGGREAAGHGSDSRRTHLLHAVPGTPGGGGAVDFHSDSPFDAPSFGDPAVTGSDQWFLARGGSKSAGPATPGPQGPWLHSQAPRLHGLPHGAADVDELCDLVLARCRPRPDETPDAMFFRCWGENPFELAREDPLSTFAADVDTASWPLVRSYLGRGLVPPKEAVRTEEMVNWFDSGVPAPSDGTFRIALEMAPHPFAEGHPGRWLMRVVVRGRDVDRVERQDLALTFVVDTSGSMARDDRLGLVKHALRLLASQLGPNDAVAVVAFSSEARVVLPMTSAGDRARIESAVESLAPGGSTNAADGLRLGYELAARELTPHAVNRVVLLSDGVANVGATGHEEMLARVEEERSKGIYLNTVGVGFGNHDDALLEQLADRGDGVCTYVDGPEEARRALVDRFTGAVQPIARDVKIQVELDPEQVHAYRLLGYENRAIADRDFRNDAVDAGELNAGHDVAVIYEIDPAGPIGAGELPLATVRVRWKDPFPVDRGALSAAARAAAEVAHETSVSIAPRDVRPDFRGATHGFQRQVLVAQLAEVLWRSVHVRDDSLELLVAETHRVAREDRDPDTRHFADLLESSRDLLAASHPGSDPLVRAIDELCRLHYQRARLELLGNEDADLDDRARDLERELEERIRRLLRERYGESR